MLRTLQPGNYTVLVRAYDNGDGNLSGTGLVELYDLHTTNGRAANISTRGQVLPDSAMIAGYIVGSGPRKDVIVRGLGPSLATSGISNALANPTLELVDGSGNLLGSNDNWESDANAARVRDAGLAPDAAGGSGALREPESGELHGHSARGQSRERHRLGGGVRPKHGPELSA